jgi:hypothetical protein
MAEPLPSFRKMPIAPPNLDVPTASEPTPELGFPAGPVNDPAIDLSGTRIERTNYIARHWRGDLSLAVSYWINGWLAWVGYFVTVLLPLLVLKEANETSFAFEISVPFAGALEGC